MRFLRRKKRERPYWLSGFEVICSACQGSHAHAVSIRCAACDGELCPTCAAHVEYEAFCAACLPGPATKRTSRRTGRSR